MGWVRLILIVAIAWLLMLGVRAARRRFGPRPPQKQLDSRKMVQCAVCEVYVPESAATLRAGRYYCSDDHADQGAGGA